MAYFASPFYQGLVSLEHSCRPKPMESTYTSSYRSMIERVYFIKLEAERAKEVANTKIEQRKKAARCRVACPLFETIYQTDYTRPDFKLALSKNFFEKQEKEKAEEKKLFEKQAKEKAEENKKQLLDGRGDEIEETQQQPQQQQPQQQQQQPQQPQQQEEQQEEQINEENCKRKNIDDVDKKKIKQVNLNKIPEWKKIGWREKKACWIRPLSERKQYQPEHIIYKYTSPCKICNEDKEKEDNKDKSKK